MATPETTEELKKHLRESLELLKTLRDEIRVEVHLAGMDMKDRWKELEPRFSEVERLAFNATQTSRRVMDETVAAFRAFKYAISMDLR
jgi:hypothetical protein